jgi:uncharacterized protein (TIGR02001 family)
MNKLILIAAISTAFVGNLANAQDKQADHDVSFNAAVVSDYRFRGISQTRLKPALQGGADYTHNPSGFYAGAWASTIKWTRDAGGGGNVEIDLYGGKRGDFTDTLSYDVGVLTYIYPSNRLNPSANTTEIYGQLGFGPAYVKYSHSVTNLFGFADSKNSGYLDVGANIDLASDFVLNLHVGHQRVRNNSSANYTDWKVGVTKDFGVVTGSLAAIGANIDVLAPNGKDLARNGLVLSVSKTF